LSRASENGTSDRMTQFSSKRRKNEFVELNFFQMVLKKYLYGEHHNLLKTFTRSNNRDCVILGHKITFVPKLQGGGSIKG
jgi:hypothetical protein